MLEQNCIDVLRVLCKFSAPHYDILIERGTVDGGSTNGAFISLKKAGLVREVRTPHLSEPWFTLTIPVDQVEKLLLLY